MGKGALNLAIWKREEKEKTSELRKFDHSEKFGALNGHRHTDRYSIIDKDDLTGVRDHYFNLTMDLRNHS